MTCLLLFAVVNKMKRFHVGKILSAKMQWAPTTTSDWASSARYARWGVGGVTTRVGASEGELVRQR